MVEQLIWVKEDKEEAPIPMPMDRGEPIQMEMDKGDPIPLGAGSEDDKIENNLDS